MVKYENEDALPLGWVWTTLGDSCHIIMGQSPPSETYNSEGVGLPFFQGKAEFGILHPKPVKWCSVPGKIAQPDDILISVRAPVGPTNLCKELSCIGRGLAAIRPELAMSNRYFFYLLRYVESGWEEKATGTTFSAISGDTLRNQLIPLAPLTEQYRIVEAIEAEFTCLDAGVAALKRLRANLKRYKAAVLKAAAEGKLVPQDPNDEPAADMLKRILRERRLKWEADQRAKGRDPQKLKYDEPRAPDTEELPELPEGWVWATVQQVGDVQLGRQRAPQHHSGKFMRPYLRVANVFEDRIDVSDVLEMNFTPSEYETYRLFNGDILLNEGQSLELVGRPAIYRDEVPGACFQNTLVRFRVADGLMPEYALSIFRAYLHNGRFQKIARWTTNIAHLGAQRFAVLEFPLPSLNEQRKIVDKVEELLSVMRFTEKLLVFNIKRAERLRQAILRDAFAGRLVAQDPNDEPAAELLKRIQKARRQRTDKRTS